MMSAPASARELANCRPRPLVPPVTKAVRPVRSNLLSTDTTIVLSQLAREGGFQGAEGRPDGPALALCELSVDQASVFVQFDVLIDVVFGNQRVPNIYVHFLLSSGQEIVHRLEVQFRELLCVLQGRCSHGPIVDE